MDVSPISAIEHRAPSQGPVFGLLDTKFFDIRIKHELFAGDQGDAQEIAVALKLFPRNPLDKGMAFEQGRPNGRKIISLAHQLGAMAREIAGSLLGHFHRPIRSYDVVPPTIAVGRLRRIADLQFIIICATRNDSEYFYDATLRRKLEFSYLKPENSCFILGSALPRLQLCYGHPTYLPLRHNRKIPFLVWRIRHV